MQVLAITRRLMPRWVQLDANVGWTLAGRVWNIVAGFATIAVMSVFLSPKLQGYYFTFSSLIALQALFELGLSQIIVQTTSHEFAFLGKEGDDEDLAATVHGRRLLFIGRFAHRWYLAASAAYLGILATLGTAYFLDSADLPAREWMAQWLLLVVFSAANLLLNPRLAFVEGAGHPGAVALLRLRQSVVGYLLMLVMLAAGLGLWAVPVVPIVNVVATGLWLNRTTLIPDFFRRGRSPVVDTDTETWRREIVALQWRVAISFLGGYLASFVFTPILFSYQGPVVAGQWGMTFTALVAIQTLGMSWVNARGPRFGALVARGERPELDRDFRAAALRTTLLTAIGCAAFVAATWGAGWLGVAVVHRLLPIRTTIWLALAVTVNVVTYAFAVYMRAHKEEPLAFSSLVLGLVIGGSSLLGARYGAEPLAVIYLAVMMVINLPWRYAIYRRYVRRSS